MASGFMLLRPFIPRVGRIPVSVLSTRYLSSNRHMLPLHVSTEYTSQSSPGIKYLSYSVSAFSLPCRSIVSNRQLYHVIHVALPAADSVWIPMVPWVPKGMRVVLEIGHSLSTLSYALS